jgi:hypothetical protein
MNEIFWRVYRIQDKDDLMGALALYEWLTHQQPF